MEHVQHKRLCNSVLCTAKIDLWYLTIFGHFLYMVEWYFPAYHWDSWKQCQAVRQTTWNNVSLLFYVSIRRGTYRMSQKSKIDTSFDVSNHFFLNWLFSWEFDKEIFRQNWKEEWNKKFHRSKKNFHCLKFKLYHF